MPEVSHPWVEGSDPEEKAAGPDEFLCPMCHLVKHKSRCGSFGRWVVCYECMAEM